MLATLFRRLSELVVVSFGVSILTFLMIHLIPGDAAQIMLGGDADVTAQQITAMRTSLGLDQSIFVQYAHWLTRAAHGDLRGQQRRSRGRRRGGPRARPRDPR